MSAPRIVSLLPAGTEIACELGLKDNLVGISFECDHPAAITTLPRVVTTALELHDASPAGIELAVQQRLRSGKSLYIINEALLKDLRPDIIITQDLCQVCAPSGNELSEALKHLDSSPEVLFFSPHTLADVEENMHALATLTGKEAQAAAWHEKLEKAKEKARARAAEKPPARVMVLEWVDPVYCAGHWLGEMIEVAGGHDRFAQPGGKSKRVEWDDVVKAAPDVLIIAPCGFDEATARAQLPLLESRPGWKDIPAVRAGRVHPVDANALLIRPGPRLTEGLDLLSRLFHP